MERFFLTPKFATEIAASDYGSRIDALTTGAIVYVAAYAIYLALLFILLRFCFDFDLVFGCIKKCRNRKVTATSLSTYLIALLIVVGGIPIGLGVAWGLHMTYSKFVDWPSGCAIVLALTFTTCSIIGFSSWYSHNWSLNKPSRVLFYIAASACAIFAVLLTVIPKNYTFTGTTAIFLSINFAPTAYLIYLKARWDDVDLKLLYTEISK
jgi:hypothetical protein